jgi:hypothetical protein
MPHKHHRDPIGNPGVAWTAAGGHETEPVWRAECGLARPGGGRDQPDANQPRHTHKMTYGHLGEVPAPARLPILPRSGQQPTVNPMGGRA